MFQGIVRQRHLVGNVLSRTIFIAAAVLLLSVNAEAGNVKSWGFNYYGALGNNETTDRNLPVDVVTDVQGSVLSGVVSTSAGINFTLALRSDGSVWAWGSNVYGQLGTNDRTWRLFAVPAVLPANSDIVAVAAGYYHSLALKADGTVFAWGNNSYGTMGDGTTSNWRLIPSQVPNLRQRS